MDVGERREWERMKKNGRIEKSVIPILLIQLVTICHQLIHENSANKLVCMGGEDGWSWFLEGNRRNGISINIP